MKKFIVEWIAWTIFLTAIYNFLCHFIGKYW